MERRRRYRQFDPGRPRALTVPECDDRRGIGLGQGPVDRGARGFSHLLQEGRLDRLLPGGQDEFESGTVPDIGADRPGRAVDGMDRGQADRDDQAVEVQVRLVAVAASACGDAECEAAPGFGVDGVFEEVPAREGLAVKRDRKRVMPDRVLERAPDNLAGLFRTEAGPPSRGARARPHRGVRPPPSLPGNGRA